MDTVASNYKEVELKYENLLILAGINLHVLPTECNFAAMNIRVSLSCLISCNGNINFSRLFSRLLLPREYREKSLAKLTHMNLASHFWDIGKLCRPNRNIYLK